MAFVDHAEVYTRPEAALASYDRALRGLVHDGARSVRVVAVLPVCETLDRWRRWIAYEAIVNHALAHQARDRRSARELPPAAPGRHRRLRPCGARARQTTVRLDLLQTPDGLTVRLWVWAQDPPRPGAQRRRLADRVAGTRSDRLPVGDGALWAAAR